MAKKFRLPDDAKLIDTVMDGIAELKVYVSPEDDTAYLVQEFSGDLLGGMTINLSTVSGLIKALQNI